jgi:hypothetical protein
MEELTKERRGSEGGEVRIRRKGVKKEKKDGKRKKIGSNRRKRRRGKEE